MRLLRKLQIRFYFLPFLIPLALYGFTMAPGIATEGDSGEFITCMDIFGVPHAPAYPSYILLGKIFFIPEMCNFVSALFGAFTVGCLFYVILGLVGNPVAAMLGSLVFMLGQQMWLQSTISEVYSVNAFGVVFSFWIIQRYPRNRRGRPLLLMALVLGLGAGIHHTLIILAVLFIVYLLWKFPSLRQKTCLLSAMAVIYLLGTSTYLYLPIRSGQDPAIDLYNPETYHNFVKVITMKGAVSINPHPRSFKKLIAQIGVYLGAFKRQFPWIVISIGIIGLFRQLLNKSQRHEFYLLSGIFLACSLGFLILVNFEIQSNLRWQTDTFYIPSYMVFTIWVGYGITWLYEKYLRYLGEETESVQIAPFVVAVSLIPLFMLVAGFHEGDKSRNFISLDYGRNLLEACEPNAIIVTSGDNSAFPLVYLEYSKHERLDVAIVHKAFLQSEWYRDQIGSLYPQVQLEDVRTIVDLLEANVGRIPVYLDQYPSRVNIALIRQNRCPIEKLKPFPDTFQIVPRGIVHEIVRANMPVSIAYHWPPVHLRGIADASIYKDPREQTIVAYYQEGALFLGEYFLSQGMSDPAREVIDWGVKVPVQQIPITDLLHRCLLAEMRTMR